jgi:PHD/YefM family antitoxin component YafN of YafNO toxin-antitoxin module
MLRPSGRIEDVESVPATAVKNAFADVLDKVAEHGILAVTRHDKARIVMLSLPEYEALVRRAGDPLERLHDRFDQMLAAMQGPGMDRAVDELFGTAPKPSRPARRTAARD